MQGSVRGAGDSLSTQPRPASEALQSGSSIRTGGGQPSPARHAIQVGTMSGLDGDDSGIFERTLRFYREIGIDSATVGIVVPMPGTPFFDEMVRTGRLLTTDWDRYNGKVDAVFRPSNMSPRELEQGVAWFADQFYSLPSIFDRLL